MASPVRRERLMSRGFILRGVESERTGEIPARSYCTGWFGYATSSQPLNPTQRRGERRERREINTKQEAISALGASPDSSAFFLRYVAFLDFGFLGVLCASALGLSFRRI